MAIFHSGVAATWSYVNHQEPAAAVAPAAVEAAPSPAAKPPAAAEPAVIEPEDVELEEETPVVKGPRARSVRPAAPEKAEPAKPEQTPADLEAEMKLIRGADAALRAGRSSEALTLLARHQAEHPHASLAHEREGLRAIAHCQVGAGGAVTRAERFIARAPRSPLAPRLRSACKLSE